MKVAIIGGGPAGAAAAMTLAKAGVETYLIEKDLNGDKPCGGGIPSGSLKEFDIPDYLFERKVTKVGIVAPSGYEVIAEVKNGYVGMVDRMKFDPWLREKAVESGARLIEGVFTGFSQKELTPPPPLFSKEGKIEINFKQGEKEDSIEVDAVIAADGVNSAVAKQIGAERPQVYLTVQEKVELTGETQKLYEDRCEFWYGADISPNFYGWVFPKGSFATIGTGAPYGYGKFMDDYMAAFKKRLGVRFDGAKILKRQAFPLPMGPIKKKVYGNVLLVGDAAGTVMPVSGEGIYYGIMSGKMAAEAVIKGDVASYDREWKRVYGSQFRLMSLLCRWFYKDDKWRERLVRMHDDKDAQERSLALWLEKEKKYPIYSIYGKIVKSLLKHL
ncbi:MAG: geranylgeranyl diphosphate reductase [Deltaproteobacteria bacterium]|nr:geranylgeranyl diphosphate reductase [Deltaproteobacteria bacterium]